MNLGSGGSVEGGREGMRLRLRLRGLRCGRGLSGIVFRWIGSELGWGVEVLLELKGIRGSQFGDLMSG